MTIEELFKESGKEYLSFNFGNGLEMLNIEQAKQKLNVLAEEGFNMEEEIKALAKEMAEEVISKYKFIAKDPKSVTENEFLDNEITWEWEEYFEEKISQLLDKE